MITRCARRIGEDDRRVASTGHPRSHAAPTGASAGENSLVCIWHSYLILRLRPPWQRQSRPSVLASWLVTGFLLLAADRALGPRRLHRRCPAPLRHVARSGSCTGLDLRFLVAGPGFEPGKTVVGDFYRPCPVLP
jgi:hypothetical protein